MFDFVRSHNRLLQIILGLLIFPSFIFFGVQGYARFSGPQAASVAEVDGADITQAEWDAAHRQNAERLRQQNPQADPRSLDSPAARRQSLDALLRERVLQAAAAHQHLEVSDERVRYVFVNDPQFEALRNPDGSLRKEMLGALGMSAEALVERLRHDIASGQVLQGAVAGTFVPGAVMKTALDAMLERREVQWQRFDAKDFLDQVHPSEADLQTYYADKAHAAQFRAPEEAQIQYVVLDLDALKRQLSVTDAQLREYYQANQSRYTASEERRASHILVKVDPKAPAAERAAARAKAESLLAAVRKNPAQFAEVARKNSDDPGSAAQGGDLDFFARGAMTPPFEQAVFAMKPGQISDLVGTDFGFHIIQLTGQRGGTVKPFDEVRAGVEDEVRTQLAQKKYTELAEQFTNLVYEQADTLQPAADKFKLPVQTATVQRRPAPGAAGPLASSRLLDAIFSADSVRTKRNTEGVETAPSQMVSARILQYRPARSLPFAEVKTRVLDAVRHAQAAAEARRAAETRLAELRKNPSTALPLAATVSRAQPGELPRLALDAALGASLASGPTLSIVDVGADAANPAAAEFVALLLKVLKSLPPDPAEAQTEQAKSLIEQNLSDAESQAFYQALKTRFRAHLDEDHIAAAVAADPAETASSPAP